MLLTPLFIGVKRWWEAIGVTVGAAVPHRAGVECQGIAVRLSQAEHPSPSQSWALVKMELVSISLLSLSLPVLLPREGFSPITALHPPARAFPLPVPKGL